MINWRDTVISQYANSPTILRLLESMDEWIDPAADLDRFHDLIWNLDTAEGYGLDVWGRIVGVDRVISVPTTPSYLGFQTGTPSAKPFGSAPFYLSDTGSTSNYALGDLAFRKLIYIKALSNISAVVIPVLNTLLRLLFEDRGRAYVNDYGDMTMGYTFEFTLLPWELSLLQQSGAMIRPAGVLVTIIQSPPGNVFYFAEAGTVARPFGTPTFSTGGHTI